MKKIGRFIQKILGIIILLLILGTICIFVYPKVADQTEVDDKVVNFLAEKTAPTIEGGEVGTENQGEDSTEEGSTLTDSENSSEVILPEQEAEVEYKDSYLAQTLSKDEKKALKTAYNTVLHKMGLNSDNLRFYEMKTYDGIDYYTFQVVDDFGGAYHDLLFYNPNNYNVYWHDGDGYLTNAYSTDSIFSGTIAGNKEVEYEDDSWEKVFTGYMNALLNECDDTKASTYVDSSCYYLPKLSEMKRDSFVDATKENQTFLIEEGESLAERKKSKKIDKYEWDYEIYESESYIDEYDMDWKELHIALDLDVTAHGETEHFGEYYCVYLREYEYGWRVAALTKE